MFSFAAGTLIITNMPKYCILKPVIDRKICVCTCMDGTTVFEVQDKVFCALPTAQNELKRTSTVTRTTPRSAKSVPDPSGGTSILFVSDVAALALSDLAYFR
jgi:hypothetical protein